MSEPFLGQIQVFGFNFPPRGWAFCEGQLLPISQYSALFSLLGTTYGGDGRTTFALPDIRGRVCVGVGSGPGLSNVSWGEKGGANTNTLTVAQLPPHDHGIAANSGAGNSGTPVNNYPANAQDANRNPLNIYQTAADTTTRPTQSTGNGQSVNNMQPYVGLYWSIALTGIFPSRT